MDGFMSDMQRDTQEKTKMLRDDRQQLHERQSCEASGNMESCKNVLGHTFV